MFNKRIFAFALFLALCLCACGASALEINIQAMSIPQTHLQYKNSSGTNIADSQNVSLRIQSLGGAIKPVETTKVYDESTIASIKRTIARNSSKLADDTAENLLGAIGYTGRTSVSNTAPTWSNLGGLDHMQQSRTYYLDNGQGFRLNMNALLFDLSLLATGDNGNDESLSNMDSISLNDGADAPFGEGVPYLSLNEEDNPASGLPKPGAILSSSIMDITGNTWDRTNNVGYYAPAASDRYSFNKQTSMLNLIDKDYMGDDFGNETLPNIVANAKESSPSLVTGPIFAAVGHFSPYAFVWTEVELLAAPIAPPVAAPVAEPDVPQTGDSASLAPWLLLLGGACALLALRRRIQRA